MRTRTISSRFCDFRALLILLAGGSLLVTLISAGPARADALDDVQVMREGGCGGLQPARDPLRHLYQLDRAAALWASGDSVLEAAQRAGYAGKHLMGIYVAGDDDTVLRHLRRTGCGRLMNSTLTDAGIYRRGAGEWLMLASTHVIARTPLWPGLSTPPSTFDTPPPELATPPSAVAMSSPAFARRVLALVNAVRARGTSCGRHAFGPTTPVRLSATLQQVAGGHARDMAEHDYFEHQDLSGRTPADRVRAAGYREQLVGENIAFGPSSPEDVVRGWLHSPGHCENIMDPRFAEMGVAYAYGPAPQGAYEPGLYWVQDFVDPR